MSQTFLIRLPIKRLMLVITPRLQRMTAAVLVR